EQGRIQIHTWRALPDAGWVCAAGVVSPFQSEHANRQADRPDVSQNFRRGQAPGRSNFVAEQQVRGGLTRVDTENCWQKVAACGSRRSSQPQLMLPSGGGE